MTSYIPPKKAGSHGFPPLVVLLLDAFALLVQTVTSRTYLRRRYRAGAHLDLASTNLAATAEPSAEPELSQSSGTAGGQPPPRLKDTQVAQTQQLVSASAKHRHDERRIDERDQAEPVRDQAHLCGMRRNHPRTSHGQERRAVAQELSTQDHARVRSMR